jgi:hypothetical protein
LAAPNRSAATSWEKGTPGAAPFQVPGRYGGGGIGRGEPWLFLSGKICPESFIGNYRKLKSGFYKVSIAYDKYFNLIVSY